MQHPVATLDAGRRSVVGCHAVRLSPQLWRLAEILFEHRDTLLSHEFLLDRLYADDPDGITQSARVVLRNLIVRMRRALSGAGCAWVLQSHYGTGYTLTTKLTDVRPQEHRKGD